MSVITLFDFDTTVPVQREPPVVVFRPVRPYTRLISEHDARLPYEVHRLCWARATEQSKVVALLERLLGLSGPKIINCAKCREPFREVDPYQEFFGVCENCRERI